jgi:hypothetical protein
LTINDNIKDLRQKKIVICHKLASDKGALAMMFGGDEEPQPNVIA